MRNKLGSIIRKARENKGLNRKEAAKQLGISSSYVAHLECNRPVHLSEKLASKIVKKLDASPTVLRMREAQNERSRRYYKGLSKKRAS